MRVAAISGALAVGLGALGAHALKPLIAPHRLEYFEKAVQYQFAHTVALMVVAVLLFQQVYQQKWLRRARWAFIAGIVCFSGSLYLLAITELISIPTQVLGPITPLGGLFLIAGWISLAMATVNSQPKE
jgi:uncharacterized membrane protein YgdD (TMEM256/DUF423 family)